MWTVQNAVRSVKCKNHPDALHWREGGATGATLLHAAAEADMLTMCVLLEELGADLEATDQNGKRPWEVAGPFCSETFNNYGSFRPGICAEHPGHLRVRSLQIGRAGYGSEHVTIQGPGIHMT
eukprot:s975_g5.t1